MSKRADHDRLEQLWLADPHCHWCGQKTWLPKSGDELLQHPGGPRAHMATRDHIVSRLETPDHRKGGEIVLACYKCNNRRSAEVQATHRDRQRRASNVTKLGYAGLRHALAEDPTFLDAAKGS